MTLPDDNENADSRAVHQSINKPGQEHFSQQRNEIMFSGDNSIVRSNKFNLQALRRVLIACLIALGMFPLLATHADTLKPPERLQTKGTITYCSDIASPPLGYYDVNNKPKGSDIEFGTNIAKRMGLKVKWNNMPFSGLIPALLAGHCDAIISQLFDKPARRKVIDFVDYMYSSEAILAEHGNPHNIHSLDDLSGLKVAVENGTTVRTILESKNDELQKNNKKKMKIIVFPKDTDALEQLKIGQVDAYGTTIESAGYYIQKAPKSFAIVSKPFHRILTGIGIRKNESQLKKAIQQALDAMMQDGTYMKILKKWNLGEEALSK